MAKSTRERVDEGLQLMRAALAPFVEREMKATFRDGWLEAVQNAFATRGHHNFSPSVAEWDLQALLAVSTKFWKETFERTLGSAERNFIGEIWEVRNRHAHPSAKSNFTYQDTFRALDTMARLAESISAPEADLIRKGANEVLRLQYDEQTRHERRKAARTVVEGQPSAHLKPWREVMTPHDDVAQGNFERAAFAADLWRVYMDPQECPPEYGHPIQFFQRTYITTGLKMLLGSALKRLSGKGGDAVTQLQTNFGGGKTHSMLALYHLCGDQSLQSLPGLEDVLSETGIASLERVSRVVLVGTKLCPGQPQLKEDGTEVHTLWGEMAWQLGGRAAYDRIRKADETATNPNETDLRALFSEYGPVLILIDEWVAYARGLHDEADLSGGSFETQFTFAQALTEAVSSIPNALLIVSLPASDSAFADGTSPASQDLTEVGGTRGVEALRRLRNVIGRKDAPWRAATQEESYEIVRRRLFKEITDDALYRQRDACVRAFYEMYLSQTAEFPGDTRKAEYEARMKAAYPVHPELFDRLYSDWGSLVKFQRTRGVLRLMATVVNLLWEGNDSSPMILPGHVPLSEPSVAQELNRYLEDNWVPVLDKDVDGAHSLPLDIDRNNSNLARFSATRRVARTLFIGSAPTLKAANKGIDEQRIKLGCVQPGETAAIFTDAISKLAKRATFLFDDGGRYWFSTSPSLNRLAEDEAKRYEKKEEVVHAEIQRRLEKDLNGNKGAFAKFHLCPINSHEVPDEMLTRLVILGPDKIHQRNEKGSAALKEAEEIMEKRGNKPRELLNTLVFLAPDIQRLDDLSHAVRFFLAWNRIQDMDEDAIDLTTANKRQIETRIKEYDRAIEARLAETWCWLIVPRKPMRSPDLALEEVRLQGTGSLAERASRKLQADAELFTKIGPSVVRDEVDKVPLWRGQHLEIRQLLADFAKHLYLPRVTHSRVLLDAISEGVALANWEQDGFAYADGFDGETGRYRGLSVMRLPVLDEMDGGLIVKPEAAIAQIKADAAKKEASATGDQSQPSAQGGDAPAPQAPGTTPATPDSSPVKKPSHFHASASLSATKLTPQVAKLSEEVIQHLASKLGVQVEITLDIQATLPEGFDPDTIRTVTENCRALKLDQSGFEDQ